MKRITTAEFIRRARAAHGDKYDYSLSKYSKWDGAVDITCNEHGSFKQSANNHLAGKGCKECAKTNIGNANRGSKTKFVDKAIKMHGNKYCYDQVKYKTARIKVTITCREHGSFTQVPDSHVRGSGCPQCGNISSGKASRMLVDEFILRASIKHNDKYDYELVEYVNTITGVKIKCPEHGVFSQGPGSHLGGAGCPDCAGNLPITTEDFVGRAKAIHDSKYSYELVKVSSTKLKVSISCPVHGVFLQSPTNHLKGHGCPDCGGRVALTPEGFIAMANKVHGDKYRYEGLVYKNNKTKVAIICNEHGVFNQVPDSHLSGNGCPECSGNRRLTSQSFIDRAKLIHDNFYTYDKVDVDGGRVKVTITCPAHGDFTQMPIDHLTGRGCLKCGKLKAADILKSERLDIIAKAKEVHGDKYDYAQLIDYQNNRQKITIVCPDHGEFSQRVGGHLRGVGCPGCATGGFDQTKPAILYYLRVETRTHLLWKIGITNRSVSERFYGEDSKKITVLKTWQYDNGREAMEKEQWILKEFDQHRYRGHDPILNLSGDTELFTVDVLGLNESGLVLQTRK